MLLAGPVGLWFAPAAMGTTDYSGAILGLIAVGVALTGMVVYIVTRPSDLGKK